VFDAGMPAADIQAKVNQILAIQEHNEMGLERYAFLLKPGAYQLVAKLGTTRRSPGWAARRTTPRSPARSPWARSRTRTGRPASRR
jgi:hypothetical protein